MNRRTLGGLAALVLSITLVALAPAPVANADHLTCFEPPDCIGQCICEQKQAEHKCFHDFDDGVITEEQYRLCIRESLHAQIACFKECAGVNPETSGVLDSPSWLSSEPSDMLSPTPGEPHEPTADRADAEPTLRQAVEP